jgi:hypothetical protein
MASPNTIMLKGKMQTRYEEARASVAITPGMLIENVSDGTVRPHTVRGGRSRKQFAVELYFAGGLVPGDVVNTPGGGIDSVYAINDLVRIKEATPTDVIYSLLKQGENVTKGDWLVSGGDGTMVKGASAVLQNIVADSATVTNTTAETTFSNGTVTVPANSLKVGDRLRVRQLVVFPATNATDTARIRMYLGATSLLDTGAVDVANGDNALLEVNLTIRTVGAGGTYVASGVAVWFREFDGYRHHGRQRFHHHRDLVGCQRRQPGHPSSERRRGDWRWHERRQCVRGRRHRRSGARVS